MNLASIITLLQLALQLLTASAGNPRLQAQVQPFISHAILSAEQVLASSTSQSQPTPPPMALFDPSQMATSTPEVQIVLLPRCTLSVSQMDSRDKDYNTVANYNAIISWSSSGIPAGTKGVLYGDEGQSAGQPIMAHFGDIPDVQGTLKNVGYATFYRIDFPGIASCSN